MSDREYTQIIDALRWNGEEYKGSLMDEEDKQLFCDAADAIERLMEEVDRKDKAIQGLLTQIESTVKSIKDKTIERNQEARNEQQP